MPNYCFNSLRIIGPAEDIAVFLRHSLCFQQFVPCPVEQRNQVWGTKWDAFDFQVVYQEDTVCDLQFRTAWGPPIPFLTKLNALYPACWFKLLFEVELGWGSGLWIHYYTPTHKKPVEHLLEWKEPCVNPHGDLILSEDESEDGMAVHPSPTLSSPPTPSSPRPAFFEPLPYPTKQV